MKTYNKAIFMPKHNLSGKTYRLQYGLHALEAMKTDRYGLIVPIRSVMVSAANLVELTLNDYGNAIKMLLRTKQNALADVCLVIIPDYDVAFLKTAWLCSCDDKHSTLNKSLYATN